MLRSFGHMARLARAGRTLARYDALLPPEHVADLPWPARAGLSLARLGARSPAADAQSRLTAALSALGPSYIKLGQFLATRPDLVGPARAFELKALQDRLPPFSMDEARAAIRDSLGEEAGTLFSEFGSPVAAASIAQVHRARTTEGREVAVKILRPGVEKRFANDLASFHFAARTMERFSAEGRRLRPVGAAQMLEQSMKLELDLRMEASAISEMAENTKDDPGLRLPKVDWTRTGRRVLTTEWIDGTPIWDIEALKTRGHNLNALADAVVQSFLRQAIRDGFFHADMHPGNLFVDHGGRLVLVDFGITGRLSEFERQVLAEILYGFITRDYQRVARAHFEAGYVPSTEDVADFVQAIRAIGEPIMDQPAEKISMARLLTQLFEVTAQFNMRTQPQLLLLQKTMVVVEGVARSLNPAFNMWVASEPVVGGWIARRLGPLGRIEAGLSSLGTLLARLPEMLEEGQRAAQALADRARANEGKPQTTGQLDPVSRAALVVIAFALAVIALRLVL